MEAWPGHASVRRSLFEMLSLLCIREELSDQTHAPTGKRRYGTFVTAGSDGAFNFWDKDSKQRLKVPRSPHDSALLTPTLVLPMPCPAALTAASHPRQLRYLP